jgi:hypothetical protein
VALTGIFGLMRGLVGDNYTLVLVAQIGIAIGQPFILNAITSVAAQWFPLQERATASGLGTLGMYLGITLGLLGLTREPWEILKIPDAVELCRLAVEVEVRDLHGSDGVEQVVERHHLSRVEGREP